MPNEEIVSALKNAIDHGESLQSAVKIMVDSGYNFQEVQEASKFIGGNLSMQELTQEEQLTMPEEKKNLVSKFKSWVKNKNQEQPTSTMQAQQPQTLQPQQSMQQPQSPQQPQQSMHQLPQHSQQITQTQIKQSFQNPIQKPPQQQILRQVSRPIPQLILRKGKLSREIQKIKPTGQGYKKEIILLIILLVLIGVLITTIVFKNTILGWFA